MKVSDKKGISTILLILVILVTAILGGGIASFMGAKKGGYPMIVQSYRAYEIANAGVEFAIRYGIDNNFASDPTAVNLTNIPFAGGSFTTLYDQAANILTSTGSFGGVTRTVMLGDFANYVRNIYDIAFDNDMADFANAITESDPDAIGVTNTSTDKYITLGGNVRNSFGSLWYSGNRAGFCGSGIPGGAPAGACTFGTGFRAYFVFRFSPSSIGEGFVFVIANGIAGNFGSSDSINNISGTAGSLRYASGGDTASGPSLGYGGDSRVGDIAYFTDRREGRGIRPPKIGVEFDINPSTCDPPGNTSFCDLGNRDHAAYVYWGTNLAVTAKNVSAYLVWQALSEYTRLRAVSNGVFRYIATNTGLSGSTAPLWPATKATMVNDGTVTWLEATWRADTQYSVGDINVPSNWNGYYYTVTAVTGNAKTGVTEPAWPTTPGTMVTDNGVTWRNSGFISNPGNSPAYDDNAHSTAAYTFGLNPRNDDPNGYFNAPAEPMRNWLVSGGRTYAYRLEVTRSITAPCNYVLKSWLKQCTDGTTECDMYTKGPLGNTGADYNPLPADPPVLNKTLNLDAIPEYHGYFDRFIFGWTEGTGHATQNVTIRKFGLTFRR